MLKAPESKAGKTVPCPRCKRSIQIPAKGLPTAEPPAPGPAREPPQQPAAFWAPVNEPLPYNPPTYEPPKPSAALVHRPEAPPEPRPVVIIRPDSPRGRRDDDDYDDRDDRRSRRTRYRQDNRDEVGFRCPYCNTNAFPVTRSKVSTAGWIFFWVFFLLIGCGWLFCWIGLLMKDEYRVCADCGMKLG
jgi:hypothetical protein